MRRFRFRVRDAVHVVHVILDPRLGWLRGGAPYVVFLALRHAVEAALTQHIAHGFDFPSIIWSRPWTAMEPVRICHTTSGGCAAMPRSAALAVPVRCPGVHLSPRAA